MRRLPLSWPAWVRCAGPGSSTGRSARRMVLYAHCEFFGGDGIHAAIAWHRESVIFGPCFTRTRGELADPPYLAGAAFVFEHFTSRRTH